MLIQVIIDFMDSVLIFCLCFFLDSFESLHHELDYIEKEQSKIDKDAAILEKRLRKVMDTGNV